VGSESSPLRCSGIVLSYLDPGTDVAIDMMTLLPGRQLRGVIQGLNFALGTFAFDPAAGDSVSKTFIPHMLEWWQAGAYCAFPATAL